MTIFEDHIYWSERYTSKVMRTNKFHGGNVTTVLNNVYQPTGIVMDHPIKQPTGLKILLIYVSQTRSQPKM